MIPRAYLQLVYELALWRSIRGHLMSILGVAKDDRTEIIAQEAPYAQRFVPMQAARETMDAVAAREGAIVRELAQWQWVRQIAATPKSTLRRQD